MKELEEEVLALRSERKPARILSDAASHCAGQAAVRRVRGTHSPSDGSRLTVVDDEPSTLTVHAELDAAAVALRGHQLDFMHEVGVGRPAYDTVCRERSQRAGWPYHGGPSQEALDLANDPKHLQRELTRIRSMHFHEVERVEVLRRKSTRADA